MTFFCLYNLYNIKQLDYSYCLSVFSRYYPHTLVCLKLVLDFLLKNWEVRVFTKQALSKKLGLSPKFVTHTGPNFKQTSVLWFSMVDFPTSHISNFVKIEIRLPAFMIFYKPQRRVDSDVFRQLIKSWIDCLVDFSLFL